MAQGDFTKEEAKETMVALEEMFTALPKSKKAEFAGHLFDISLFINAAGKAAPTEAELKEKEANATDTAAV